jgi:hypothetical protein
MKKSLARRQFIVGAAAVATASIGAKAGAAAETSSSQKTERAALRTKC